MSKQDFLLQLRKALSGLPQDTIEEQLTFYGEMIDDRMEDGLSEEEAVAAIGTVEELAGQILADTPFTVLVKEKIRPKKKLRVWEVVLLVLGSPVWLSLLIAAFAVVLALYVSIWAVVISLWAVFASLAVCGPAGIAAGVFFAVRGKIAVGGATASVGIFCAGLAVFLFFGCKAVTKGVLYLTKKFVHGLKNSLIGKETAQ